MSTFSFGFSSPASSSSQSNAFSNLGNSNSNLSNSSSFKSATGTNSIANPSTGFSSFSSFTPNSSSSSSSNSMGANTTTTNTSTSNPSGFTQFGLTPSNSSLQGGFSSSLGAAPSLAAANPSNPIPDQQQLLKTKFSDLPENYKSEIIRFYNEFKSPMNLHLIEMKNSSGDAFPKLKKELDEISVKISHLRSSQVKLYNQLMPLLEETRSTSKGFRIQSSLSFQEIRSRGGGASGGLVMQLDESGSLPTSFYLGQIQMIENKLVDCIEAIRYFDKQNRIKIRVLEALKNPKESKDLDVGVYGEIIKVGPKQLVKIIQLQSEQFIRISSNIAMIHKEVSQLKSDFLKIFQMNRSRSGVDAIDPFLLADRKEMNLKKKKELKISPEDIRSNGGGFLAAASHSNINSGSGTPGLGLATGTFPATNAQPSSSFSTMNSFSKSPGTSTTGTPAFSASSPNPAPFGTIPATTSGFGTGFGTGTSFGTASTATNPVGSSGSSSGFGTSLGSGSSSATFGSSFGTPSASTGFSFGQSSGGGFSTGGTLGSGGLSGKKNKNRK